jgi:hypothetical protein
MPAELYEQVVLPCWKSNALDDDVASTMVMSVSDVPDHSFALRPMFAELTARLGRLCTELNKSKSKK